MAQKIHLEFISKSFSSIELLCWNLVDHSQYFNNVNKIFLNNLIYLLNFISSLLLNSCYILKDRIIIFYKWKEMYTSFLIWVFLFSYSLTYSYSHWSTETKCGWERTEAMSYINNNIIKFHRQWNNLICEVVFFAVSVRSSSIWNVRRGEWSVVTDDDLRFRKHGKLKLNCVRCMRVCVKNQGNGFTFRPIPWCNWR